MKQYTLNPDIFFLLNHGNVVLWDYQAHQQFEIEAPYLERLKEWSRESVTELSPLDAELVEAGLLLPKDKIDTPSWGWDLLSRIFHLGTKDVNGKLGEKSSEDWVDSYITHCQDIAEDVEDLYYERQGEKISLPAPDLGLLEKRSFWDVLKSRKTSRHFSKETVSLLKISTLLYATFGTVHGSWEDLKKAGLRELGFRKTSSCGGGFHEIEAYLVATNIEGLTPGLYHYSVKNHALIKLREEDFTNELPRLMDGHFFANELSYGIFLTARLNKMWLKYPHSRAYRVVLLNAGHLSQTYQLVATSLGISTWISGAFSDSLVEDFLKIQSPEVPLFFLGGGTGEPRSLHPKMIEYHHNHRHK